jgi:hypothetical protein
MDLRPILAERQRPAPLRDTAHPRAVNHGDEEERKQPPEKVPEPGTLIDAPSEFDRVSVQFFQELRFVDSRQPRSFNRRFANWFGVRSVSLANANQLVFRDLHFG